MDNELGEVSILGAGCQGGLPTQFAGARYRCGLARFRARAGTRATLRQLCWQRCRLVDHNVRGCATPEVCGVRSEEGAAGADRVITGAYRDANVSPKVTTCRVTCPMSHDSAWST